MDINCALFIQWGSIPTATDRTIAVQLPCYPEEITEQVNATWSTQNIIGRTGTLAAYTGTEDITVSFSFDLHREMEIQSNSTGSDPATIDFVVSALKAACYPLYGPSTMKPPLVMFKFGNLEIDGRLTSLGITRKGPIINDFYAVYSLSVSLATISNKVRDANDILLY